MFIYHHKIPWCYLSLGGRFHVWKAWAKTAEKEGAELPEWLIND